MLGRKRKNLLEPNTTTIEESLRQDKIMEETAPHILEIALREHEKWIQTKTFAETEVFLGEKAPGTTKEVYIVNKLGLSKPMTVRSLQEPTSID